MGSRSQHSAPKSKDSPLVSDHDSKNRPIGVGGRRRERDIMDIVEGAQSGKPPKKKQEK